MLPESSSTPCRRTIDIRIISHFQQDDSDPEPVMRVMCQGGIEKTDSGCWLTADKHGIQKQLHIRSRLAKVEEDMQNKMYVKIKRHNSPDRFHCYLTG